MTRPSASPWRHPSLRSCSSDSNHSLNTRYVARPSPFRRRHETSRAANVHECGLAPPTKSVGSLTLARGWGVSTVRDYLLQLTLADHCATADLSPLQPPL